MKILKKGKQWQKENEDSVKRKQKMLNEGHVERRCNYKMSLKRDTEKWKRWEKENLKFLLKLGNTKWKRRGYEKETMKKEYTEKKREKKLRCWKEGGKKGYAAKRSHWKRLWKKDTLKRCQKKICWKQVTLKIKKTLKKGDTQRNISWKEDGKTNMLKKGLSEKKSGAERKRC